MAELIGVFVASWLVAFVVGRFVFHRASGKLRLPATALVVAFIVAPGAIGGHGFAIVPMPVAIYESRLQVVTSLFRFHALSLLATFAVTWASLFVWQLIAKKRTRAGKSA